jgi:hypothetical protein
MKKIYVLVLILFLSFPASAQKTLPAIKQGTTINMNVDFHGQGISLNLVYKSLADPINIAWDIGNAGGTYAMKATSLQNGTKFNVDQPEPDGTTTLADDETFMCISKSAYQSLQKNKTFIYSGLTFIADDNATGFKIGDKAIDATYLATADGKTSVWILNNPDFPVTLAMKGNPAGVDYTVTGIK